MVREWPSGGGAVPRTPTAPASNIGSKAPRSSKGVERAPGAKDKVPEGSPPPFSSHSTPEEARPRELPQLAIAGWVLDEAGAPVPGIVLGAAVRYLLQQPEHGASAWSGGVPRTQTDDTGFFRLPELANGEYDVRTEATERYSAARAVLRAGVDSAVLVVKEDEEHEVYVYGSVKTTKGKPLERVRVLPIGQRTQHATYTDETGNYGLSVVVSGRRQSYQLRFMREGYREQRLMLPDTDVRNGGDIRLDVRMDPINALGTVTGTVTGPDGAAVAVAPIQLLSASLQRLYQTVSDSAGSFVFPAVELAADYRLWVRPNGRYKDYIREGLEVTAQGLNLAVVLEALQDGSLAGWMVDAQGNPVPQFSLWLRSSSVTGPPSLLVTGDQRGYFFVDGLPEGQLSLQTLSLPYLSVSGIELPPGAAKEVQLTLDWGHYQAYGYVLNANGEPLPGSQVSLSWIHAGQGVSSSSSRRTVADARGYFLFTQLGPGPHILNINAAGFRSAQLDHDTSVHGGEILVQLEAVSP